jgi:hypothetical protein
MLRTDDSPDRREFDQVIQFLRWLTLFLAVTVFVAALAVGLILMSAPAAKAQIGDATKPCVTGHRFEPGPIVNGHHRQPTQSEIETRTQELWARSKASAGAC